MMLVIQAASPTTKLWLTENPKPADPSVVWESGRALADQLLPHVMQLLADHQAALSDITGIIMFSGPGSFTSLRIGHSVGNALADGLRIPIVGATGDTWLADGHRRLTGGENDHIVVPFYGGEANITVPKA